jgi:hypothetical protein
MQAIDHPLQLLPLLLFDTRHAPKATGMIDGSAGFGDGDRILVAVNLTPQHLSSPVDCQDRQHKPGKMQTRKLAPVAVASPVP